MSSVTTTSYEGLRMAGIITPLLRASMAVTLLWFKNWQSGGSGYEGRHT